jgi:hypothetical protein
VRESEGEWTSPPIAKSSTSYWGSMNHAHGAKSQTALHEAKEKLLIWVAERNTKTTCNFYGTKRSPTSKIREIRCRTWSRPCEEEWRCQESHWVLLPHWRHFEWQMYHSDQIGLKDSILNVCREDRRSMQEDTN